MNLSSLLSKAYLDLNYAASPAADVVTRFTSWINEGHRQILRLPGMVDLRQATLPFTSVAGVTTYGVPQAFERIDAIVQTTNNVRLLMRTRDWYRSLDPGERSTGNPYYYVPAGLGPCLRQPAVTGSGVWAVSDQGADTTQVVSLIGVRLNGDETGTIATTLNGTTRVAIGGGSAFTDYVEIIRWDLSAAATGNVSLYDAATNGNLLARLVAGRTAVTYECVRLWPTPSAPLPYLIDGQLVVPDLANATDIPMLPEAFHDVLVCYARFREYKKTGALDQATIELEEFDATVGKIQSSVSFPNDYRPVAGALTAQEGRWNNVGPWFPADGWGN